MENYFRLHFSLMSRYKIMKSCWNAEPNKRPLFIELVDFLGDLLEDGLKSVRFTLACNSHDITFLTNHTMIVSFHVFQQHYASLNDYHEKLNAERSPALDFMKLITKRRDSSSSIEPGDNAETKIITKHKDSNSSHELEENKEARHSNEKQHADRNEIEMVPIVHNPGR